MELKCCNGLKQLQHCFALDDGAFTICYRGHLFWLKVRLWSIKLQFDSQGKQSPNVYWPTA